MQYPKSESQMETKVKNKKTKVKNDTENKEKGIFMATKW